MAQRGRKSAAALSVVSSIPGSRPEPPAELTEEQAEVWRSVVQTKPAEWFTDDSHPLLVAYCKHVTTARVLSQQIDRFEPEWLKEDDGPDRYKRLLDMREKETRAVTSLARSMRLTQQSRYDTSKAGRHAAKETAAKKPWQ